MRRLQDLPEIEAVASDDLLLLYDTSGEIVGVISIANAFGIPDLGWVSAGETWTYNDYSATTRIAQINVPTGATNKYTAGMRVRFSQTTDGVKYGIIHKVDTSLLHVFLPDGTDFDDETISAPAYSTQKAPFGFDNDPSKWTLQTVCSSRSTTSQTPVGLTDNLVHGPGAWDISLQVEGQLILSGNVNRWGYAGLSSDGGSSKTDSELYAVVAGTGTTSGLDGMGSTRVQKYVIKTAETTWTLTGNVNSSSCQLDIFSGAIIRAVSAYL